MVAHTAKVLAGVLGMEIAALEALTTSNFETLFPKAS
jgi:Tat protein secretion system quality control protein TatD with DNase activity